MPQISIIIPVFNAEKYLARCLDSVLNQTLKDVEIILVNDGSIDNSAVICDEYAQRDNRIKVIHQKNQGVSVARNNALSIANGDYIGFVDSDDYIHPQMFEKLLNTAATDLSDIVMCDALTVYDNGKTEDDTIAQLPNDCHMSKQEITPNVLLELAGAVWRCIYSCKLIKENQFFFQKGLKFSEDRIFNIYAFGYAKQITYIKKPFYYRYVNLESTVHRFHNDFFESYKKAKQETEMAIKIAWNDDEKYQKAYLSQFITGAFASINNYFYKTSPLTSKQKRQAIIDLCNDDILQKAIKTKGITLKQEKWIINKNYNLLILRAKLANFKHRR